MQVKSKPDSDKTKMTHGTKPISENTLVVSLNAPLTATQWNKHGDHPAVYRMNGSNWEFFPDENDDHCGLLPGNRLVNAGDWIIWSEVFKRFAVFSTQELEQHFSAIGDQKISLLATEKQ